MESERASQRLKLDRCLGFNRAHAVRVLNVTPGWINSESRHNVVELRLRNRVLLGFERLWRNDSPWAITRVLNRNCDRLFAFNKIRRVVFQRNSVENLVFSFHRGVLYLLDA